MRAALSLTRRVSARGASASALSPRGSAESSELSEACNAALQAQERAFSSGGMLRMRASSSPWTLQHERQSTAALASSSSSLAAAAAWQASVLQSESTLVEDWLAAMHQVDAEARNVCSGLLSRHPTLLYRDATRTTGVVQALVEATRQRHLLRPYHMQDTHILALVDRYTPESLRARLSELHRLVWQKLDDSNTPALFAGRTSLDMLDLDAKALALKAQALRALIPEFLPSTVLRACPELLDVQVDDLPQHVRRAGDVVVVGAHTQAELVGPNNVVIVRSKVLEQQQSASAAGTASAAAMASPGSSPPLPVSPFAAAAAAAGAPGGMAAGRLLRTARCGAQALLRDSAPTSAATMTPSREVTKVFCNTRQLVYAAGDTVEVRVEDPHKAQEDLSAACRMAVLQRLSLAGQASTGHVRVA
ncbi:hypothetical protein HXX76_000838 [Chlamydomonas incerta]|uniref:Uncharacterized protein n=1 Tax=Chlamydomonas incerta TaxID=51695 RepID=A0A835WF43_CHLIN|nr:hypothetical protein HXX76_000838 [Chlamydomonas incerta]|eukprot:KAG2446246.1 hypothetical protein HXX76_000838 [Chlamydomonas incerta]